MPATPESEADPRNPFRKKGRAFRIIDSIKSAIRFAGGDKSAGKQSTVQVPQFTAAQLRKFQERQLSEARHLRVVHDTEGKPE